MNPWVRGCLWLYRRLARAFPAEFRRAYGADMERLGEDAAPEIWRRRGFVGLAGLLTDAAMRLAIEYLAELRQDTAYALRRLGKAPGFTAVGIVSLALSIGMCSMFYAQVSAIMRPISGARNPEELLGVQGTVSYPHFERFQAQREIVAEAAAFIGPTSFSAGRDGEGGGAERVVGHLVSPEYFSVLGVTPAAGRLFSLDTEKPGAAPAVVISDRFWRRRLNADSGAVGSTLRVNGKVATIVGIGPEGFLGVYPVNPAEIFVPVSVGPEFAPELRDDALHNAESSRFRVVLRAADGVSADAVESGLDVAARNIEAELAKPKNETERKPLSLVGAGASMPMGPKLRWVLFGINGVLLGLVLSLACANLSGLLLARGNERRREIAIRLAAGAGRFRLVRQLLTESVILSLAGGLAGLALSAWLLTLSVTAGEQAPFELDIRVDWNMALFVLGASALAGVGFGLAPALATTRTDITSALKDGSSASRRRYRRFGMRNMFVVYQVAGSLMLSLITGFLVVGYQQSYGLDPGFETANLYFFQIDPARDGYSAERSARLLETLPERLSRLREVEALALTDRPPADMMIAPGARTYVSTDEGGEEKTRHSVLSQRVGAGYFAALGAPILRGRPFDDRDGGEDSAEAAATPVVVNQAAARELFGADDPIGGSVRDEERSYTVVGVSQDVKAGLLSSEATPTLFFPLTAEGFGAGAKSGTTVMMRGALGASPMEAVRAETASLDPNLTIFDVRTMGDYLDQVDNMIKWSGSTNGSLGLFGLILASIGLWAVTAHAVASRRKEIGIRMALGARSGQVLRLVMKEGAVLTAVGSVLGFAAAAAFARIFATLIEGLAEILAIGVNSPVLLVGAPLLLAVLTLLACYLPARRSTRINPMSALRVG